MNNNLENLPVVQKQNKLSTKIRNTTIKAMKIIGALVSTIGCAALTVGTISVAPL